MDSNADILERRIPDVTSTCHLPDQLGIEVDFLAGRTERWARCSTIGPGLRARALIVAGELDEARAVLDEFETANASPHELIAAAWAVSRVGSTPLAEGLLERVGQFGESFVVDEVPLGPRGTSVGLLRSTIGDLDGATIALREAAAIGDARAPIWGALARLELTRVLRCAAAVGVGANGQSTLDEAERASLAARTFFLAGGYRSLLERTTHIAGERVRGTLLIGPRWTIGFGVQPNELIGSTKGLVALRHMLANRHRPVSSIELIRLLDGGDVDEIVDLVSGDTLGQLAADEVADSEVEARLRKIFFDDSNRSRITKLLRRTISKVGESHRLLGDHLHAAIRTGHVCRYVPTSEVEVCWEV